MRYEEEQLTAAAEELKALSATITDHATLADVGVIIAGFEAMRPYVSVGLKVCPSAETNEAIGRLQESGILKPELWSTLMKAVNLARKTDVPAPVQPDLPKPCRRVQSRILGRTITLLGQRRNRLAY